MDRTAWMRMPQPAACDSSTYSYEDGEKDRELFYSWLRKLPVRRLAEMLKEAESDWGRQLVRYCIQLKKAMLKGEL